MIHVTNHSAGTKMAGIHQHFLSVQSHLSGSSEGQSQHLCSLLRRSSVRLPRQSGKEA